MKFSGTSLTNLTGLENITAIEGDILIYKNSSLVSLEGFGNVTSIGGDLVISDNNKLVEFNLDNLNAVSNDFSIYSNSSLPLSEVNALKDQVLAGDGIGGEITIKHNFDESSPGQVWFGDCYIENLSDFDKLSGYSYVTGSLIIDNAADIIDLKEMETLALTRVGGDFKIENNENLTSLVGIGNISIDGTLLIESNINLTNLIGIEATHIEDGLSIANNASLISLEGLNNLTTVGGSLTIYYDVALISLEGLENLTSIGDSVDIDLNQVLTSLNLDSLCSVGTDFVITNNYRLCNYMILDLKNQVETCPGGGFVATDPEIDIRENLDCLAP